MLELNSINVHSNTRHSQHCKSENRLAVQVILEFFLTVFASVNSTCAQPPPGDTVWHLPALSVPGAGHLQILHCPGAGLCQPRGHSRAFDTHAVSYQNITTQKVLLEKKQIGSSVKDMNKLLRVVKACSRFYTCISSLLIKPKLHSEIGAIDVNQRFLVIKSRTSLHIYKTIHNT